MLSPDVIASNTMQRTSSEPELCGDLGKRTLSNVSMCSRTTRTRSSHLHFTADDLSASRVRSTSGLHSATCIANGPCVETPDGLSTDGSIDGVNSELSSQAFEKLRNDLERAQHELRSRDDQCRALSRVRDEVDLEVEELTASLFEEAHKMVYEANVGRATAEKKLLETQMKLDGLLAEVAALKVLVITSTPANPGKRRHKRAPSAGQICNDCETYHYFSGGEDDWTVIDPLNKKEVDPIVFQYFVTWMEDSCPLKEDQFLSLIHKDNITPCLRFPNEELAKIIYKAVQSDALAIEPIKSKPKKCALTKVHGQCPYRIQTSDSAEWFPISASCRARIVSVVDFFTFLRYIRQGIIKKDVNTLFWEMMKKRAEISLANLGLYRKKDE